jgi:hypothetical protein
MANNLKKFNTVADYQAATLNYPAVSLIAANYGVFFDKTAPTPTFGGLTVYYYIEDPSVEITLFNGGGDSSGSESGSESGSGSGGGGALPTTMIVDGNSETPINTWRFQTAGEHVVQYTFENNEIPQRFLNNIAYATKIEVGDDITSISEDYAGDGVFASMRDLTSVTISDSITFIGGYAFNYCTSLTSITVEATAPPTLENYVFSDTNDCPIYVPASAVDEYKNSTSTGWNEYASRILAIQ